MRRMASESDFGGTGTGLFVCCFCLPGGGGRGGLRGLLRKAMQQVKLILDAEQLGFT